MPTFEEMTEIRDVSIDGVGPWTWTKGDHGAWDGPTEDWPVHRANILEHVANFNLVVQAGGNHGLYPRLLANMFKNVVTFEPDPLSFYCLERNCIDTANILKFPFALGDMDRDGFLHRPSMDNTGMHYVADFETNQPIQIRALDGLGIEGLGPLDYLMLDVEGFEYNVMIGAIELIKKYKPVIQLERPGPCEGMLSEMGYKMVTRSKMDVIYKIV